MTKEEIEDYLYFFWAPLLKANAVSGADSDEFQKLILLTFSQASVYIEVPGYKALSSSRDYIDEIKNEISDFVDKIVANIPGRSTDDSYWLRITTSALISELISFSDSHLQAEQYFGPYEVEKGKFTGFDFYYVAHQLQIQLPTTAEISAVLSIKTPVAIPDGDVTNIDIDACTLWLSAIQFDSSVIDATFYIGFRLQQCTISFDSGYVKSGNKIAAGLFDFHAGFVITCIPENEVPGGAGNAIAAGNTVVYPDKFVFTFLHRPGLPQPPKITLTHTEPFTASLFGSAVSTLPADNLIGAWVADKKLLSFSLQADNDAFAATENVSAVFDLKGEGKIVNPAWYFPVVSTNHPLAFGILGIGAESGYIGFDMADTFSLTWDGLENPPLKLKQFFLRSSPDTLLINYTFNPALLAKQQIKTWKGNDKQKGCSAVDLNYSTGGTGSFTSYSKGIELNRAQAGIDVNIDRPLLSNGDRIFVKTSAGLMLINNNGSITALVSGGPMDPAIAFENNAFRSLSCFALSNALILVKPVELFFMLGKINAAGIADSGECLIILPVSDIEHTLPDPYITSLFNEQPAQDGNIAPARSLKVTVEWDTENDVTLTMELADETGNVFTPKGTITDEQFADRALLFPLPHPAERAYEDLLQNAVNSANIAAGIVPDGQSYSSYQSFYHSKTNTTGAFSTLHFLPGNVSLVDVSGRASGMGIVFSKNLERNLGNAGIGLVLENTGYTLQQTYRIENNEIVSSGRFVRAFTLPHVQWEPVYFEEKNDEGDSFFERSFFPTHGVPTRIASANKADITLAPIPVTKFIVESFQDDKGKYAAASHFALPFGMNAVALFHPFAEGGNSFGEIDVLGVHIINPDIFSYSTLNFNQPVFSSPKENVTGAIQIKVTSEGYPDISRDQRPDPSFHGAVMQMPNSFSSVGTVKDKDGNDLIEYQDDSILSTFTDKESSPVTKQFNRNMWGEYVLEERNKTNFLVFKRSVTAKVPLRRVDFSGFGASIFSNWFDKTADAGAVSQVKFNILIGRVAHEVIQIKSAIIPWFIPVVRTLIIERKNHGKIIRYDTGWVATGPGEFHKGYTFHPGVVKGVYNVTSIRDTEIFLPHKLHPPANKQVDMQGVYFDADVKIENIVSGFKTTANSDSNYRLARSKKQFGYIILGNPEGEVLEIYFNKTDLQVFLSRTDVGSLGGPVDCVVNIAGSGQMMHLTRVDVAAAATTEASIVAARGVLQLPKGGSWSVVKKITNGATLPLANGETAALIRNGILDFTTSPAHVAFNNSLHVIGNPADIEKYAPGKNDLATTEYALLQSTNTQKLLFPRPSFNSNNNAVIRDGITVGEKKIFVTDPVLADPYSLLKGNTIFPDSADALTLGKVKGFVDNLIINTENAGISFPNEPPLNVSDTLAGFVPLESAAAHRTLTLLESGGFKIFIDYDGSPITKAKQLFSVALNGDSDDAKRWQMKNQDVAIVVYLDIFQPLLTVTGNFNAEPGKKPEFTDAKIIWNEDVEALRKIIQVLSILYQLSKEDVGEDVIAKGFNFSMGNSPDSWSYKCNIEEKIPVIQFPNPVQLAQLPGPALLIVEAGLDLGIFFNLSLAADPNNPIKAGGGVSLGFEATIQVLLITIEVATAYAVGTSKVEIFIELPGAKPTFKFTFGFGATVAVQLPVVGYVSITRVISLGATIDNHMEMTVGQLLKGVLTIAGGLASVSIQVEASGTVSNKGGDDAPNTNWTATVRGVFTLDVTVAFVLSWDFSREFVHEIDLPNPR